SQKPIVTIGLMWAPLAFPSGDNAIIDPTDPKKNPLMILRTVKPGTSATKGLLSANMKITDDKPISNNNPVPHNSAMKISRRDGVSSDMAHLPQLNVSLSSRNSSHILICNLLLATNCSCFFDGCAFFRSCSTAITGVY